MKKKKFLPKTMKRLKQIQKLEAEIRYLKDLKERNKVRYHQITYRYSTTCYLAQERLYVINGIQTFIDKYEKDVELLKSAI